MKRFLLLIFMLFLVGYAPVANGLVLTFDDVNLQNANSTYLQDGYGGMNWNQMMVSNISDSAYENAAVSGDQFALNAFAQIATVGSDVFDFNGAYFSAGWKESLNIKLTGYLNGEALFTNVINVSNREAVWHSFDYTGIDSLSFYSYSDVGNPDLNHFAMDNFTYNETQPAPVPEPSTMMLLGLGVIGAASQKKFKA